MPPLEGDEEEVKKRKRINFINFKQIITTLPILFAKIKTGNNLKKLKNEIRQIPYLFYQHNKMTKKFYNNLIMLL